MGNICIPGPVKVFVKYLEPRPGGPTSMGFFSDQMYALHAMHTRPIDFSGFGGVGMLTSSIEAENMGQTIVMTTDNQVLHELKQILAKRETARWQHYG